jgi:hypothetical protein
VGQQARRPCSGAAWLVAAVGRCMSPTVTNQRCATQVPRLGTEAPHRTAPPSLGGTRSRREKREKSSRPKDIHRIRQMMLCAGHRPTPRDAPQGTSRRGQRRGASSVDSRSFSKRTASCWLLPAPWIASFAASAGTRHAAPATNNHHRCSPGQGNLQVKEDARPPPPRLSAPRNTPKGEQASHPASSRCELSSALHPTDVVVVENCRRLRPCCCRGY